MSRKKFEALTNQRTGHQKRRALKPGQSRVVKTSISMGLQKLNSLPSAWRLWYSSRMRYRTVLAVASAALALCSGFAAESGKKSGFFDSIFKRKSSQTGTSGELAGLTTGQLTSGVKETVEKGLLAAVNALGRTNGFLTNAAVRIAFPEQLKKVESALRTLKQDALVDEFEMTMNRAAEKAVPAGTEVLVNSLKQMSVQDAAQLIQSKSSTAITDYFKRTSTNELAQKFLPIVQEATSQTGVTSAYKQLLSKASFGGFSLLSRPSLDVDQYVTHKSLDGLFVMIGEEEKRIRENPAARTTELLQKVFGAVAK